MRILVVHNRYRQRGGEDVVVEAEYRLLGSSGHDVSLYSVSNDDLDESHQLHMAYQTVWNNTEKKLLAAEIARVKPEIVHVHNTFPKLSPAVYFACAKEGVPVVQTLHNYRLACVSGLLLREGGVCIECLGRTVPIPGIVHACYHNSRAQSTVVASMLTSHNLIRTWTHRVKRFITPTNLGKALFIQHGIPESIIRVKPNFVERPPESVSDPEANAPFLFVGRLVQEKGVEVLIDAWKNDLSLPPLRIVGDGPLRESVAALARSHDNVVQVGALNSGGVAREMEAARALVMPSIVYEGFGMTAIEAFSHARAVIASGHGAIGELVDDGNSGWHIEPGSASSLIAAVHAVANNHDECVRRGKAARAEFEMKYTAERNLELLEEIYAEAMA